MITGVIERLRRTSNDSDAWRLPLLMRTLTTQGIQPPLPQPETYACKLEVPSR